MGRVRDFVGMNKWGHDASACLLRQPASGELAVELVLKERITRNKRSHGTLEAALLRLRDRVDPRRARIAESS